MNARQFHPDGSAPADDHCFVFGSNLSGIHGAGAAKAAHALYGAKWGFAEGWFGRSYAIPTVQEHIAGPLSLVEIRAAVNRFKCFAERHSKMRFFVTRVGCVLAGHADSEIAPMFADVPLNCSLPDKWQRFFA